MKIYYNMSRVGGEAIPTAGVDAKPMSERPIIYDIGVSDDDDMYWFDSDGLSVKMSDFDSAEIGIPDKRRYLRDCGDVVLQSTPYSVRTFSAWGYSADTMQRDLQRINEVVQRVCAEPVHFEDCDPETGEAMRYMRNMIELN